MFPVKFKLWFLSDLTDLLDLPVVKKTFESNNERIVTNDEHRRPPAHPAGTSNEFDICNNIKKFWQMFYNGRLWENNSLTDGVKLRLFLKEMILHKYTSWWIDLTYLLVLTVHLDVFQSEMYHLCKTQIIKAFTIDIKLISFYLTLILSSLDLQMTLTF